MKRIITLLLFTVVTVTGYAQVGIGTPLPNNSAQLDIVANDKGVLFPRIALTNSGDVTTITNGNVTSLFVYNTATSGDLVPGYHYWDGNRWQRVTNDSDIAGLETLTVISQDVDAGTITYTDENGDDTVLDLAAMIAANETLTTLIDNGNGTITYTDEDGNDTVIDLAAIIDNFETLTTISIDITAGTITYTDEDGNTTVLDLAALVDAHETLTILTDNGDGTMTYTDEDGNDTVIDLATIIDNFETVTTITDNGDGTITYVDEDGNPTTIDIGAIIDAEETLTVLELLIDGSTLQYTDEDGNTTQIDLAAIIDNFETVTTITDNGDGTVTYVDEDGNPTTIDIGAIVDAEETLTTLTDNGDGTMTYVDEDGNSTVIDLATIIDNFETLTTITDNGDGTVTYVDEDGNPTTIDIGAIVDAEETLTVLELLLDGRTLQYTDEDGNTTQIDLAVVIDNFETLTTISIDAVAGTITYVDEDGNPTVLDVGALVTAQETITTLIRNDGQYTYTSEDGTMTTFNVTQTAIGDPNLNGTNGIGGDIYVDASNGDVYTWNPNTGMWESVSNSDFSPYDTNADAINDARFFRYLSDETTIRPNSDFNIQDNGDVGIGTNLPDAKLDVSGGDVQFENYPNTRDDNGTTPANNILYTDANGNVLSADAATVITGFETITTLVNNGDGTYTYTSEDGTATTYDVTQTGTGDPNGNGTTGSAGDVYVDETTGDIWTFDGTTWVQQTGDGTQSVVTQTVTTGNELATHDDGLGNITSILETVTTLIDNGDGTFTYTTEDGTTASFDVTQTGTGDPNGNGTTGTAGDIYVDESTGDIWTHDGTTWVQQTGSGTDVVTTLIQTDGTYTYTSEDGTMTTFNVTQTGTGDPNGNGTVGAAGDVYVDETTGDVWTFDGTTWVQQTGDGTQSVVTQTVTTGNELATHDDGLGNITSILETITTLIDNGDGTYTYTTEDGTTASFDVTQTGTGDPNGNGTTGSAGDIYVDESTGDVWTHDGTTWVQQTGAGTDVVTTLIQSNGQYTYTSEDGTMTTFNVTQTGTGDPNGNGTVGAAGDVYVDETTGDVWTFDGTTWVQQTGSGTQSVVTQTVTTGNELATHDDGLGNITSILETVTTLIDNGDGTYTYTTEDGTTASFDVTQTGTGDPNGNGTTGTAGDIYVDESTGDIWTFDGTTWVQQTGAGTDVVTTLIQSNGQYTYTSEDGTMTTFNVTQTGTGDPNGNGTTGAAGDVYVDETTGDVWTFDGTTWVQQTGDGTQSVVTQTVTTGNELATHDDGLGNITSILETVTTLIDNGDGTFTYTTEDGTTASFDVTQTGTGDPNGNGTTGTAGDIYVDESTGDIWTHDGTTWVQQTGSGTDVVTTLIQTDGTYTYTSEDGTMTTFNVTQTGTGDPNGNGTVGAAGDVYVDETTGDVWTFDGTTWVQQTSGVLADLRLVGTGNHITQDAGVGSNGTDAGTGSNNIAIGADTGSSLTTGSDNVIMGANGTGSSLDTGESNVLIGNGTGSALTESPSNVFIGQNAGENATYNGGPGNGWNVFIGRNTGRNAGTGTTFGFNSVIGSQSFANNATGDSNAIVGNNTYGSGTSGNRNALMGSNIMQGAFGDNNTIMGQGAASAGSPNINNNVVIGQGAAGDLQSDNNIIIGHLAGIGTTFPSITGARNILIGQATTLPDPTATNQLAIGNLIYGTNLDGIDTTVSTGNIGIGTTTPNERLEVNGSIRMTDGNEAAGRIMVSDANGTGIWTDPVVAAGDHDWYTEGTTLPPTAITDNIFTQGSVRYGDASNTITGANSMVGGTTNTVTAANSYINGNNNAADGNSHIMTGNNNTIATGGSNNIVAGQGNSLTGNFGGNSNAVFGGGNSIVATAGGAANGTQILMWGAGNTLSGGDIAQVAIGGSGNTGADMGQGMMWGGNNTITRGGNGAVWGAGNNVNIQTGNFAVFGTGNTVNSAIGNNATFGNSNTLTQSGASLLFGSSNALVGTGPTTANPSHSNALWGRNNALTGVTSAMWGQGNVQNQGGHNAMWGANNIIRQFTDAAAAWGNSNELFASDNSASWGSNNAMFVTNNSAVWGDNNTVGQNSHNSTSWGSGNTVSNNNANSAALGVGATTTAANQFVGEFAGNMLFNPTNGANVGIGTNAPTERLEVDGNIYASGAGNALLTDISVYADYVFEDYVDGSSTLNAAYTFKTLEEVEAFVKQYKHLPGVTGIKELKKTEEGQYVVNISELSGQLLEKVEELFIHTIEQQKEIEDKDQKIQQLEARLQKLEKAVEALTKN